MKLRKDYILDRWVIISEKRGKRPHEFKKSKEKHKSKDKDCFFCPGNEELTPKEIYRRNDNKGKWKIRVIPNKFAAVDIKSKTKNKQKKHIKEINAYGYHEVLIETNKHNKQLWDLDEKEIAEVLEVYNLRIKELEKDKNIKYVTIFKNHGKEAGTSLVHSHSQIVAYNKIPKTIKDKLKASKKYKNCPYCKIIKKESKSKRKCFENNNFIAFAPFASRFNYEVWLMPKKHIKKLEQLDKKQTRDMAKILKKVLEKLKKINCSYNFYIHYAPGKTDLHLSLEICPRIAKWAGFETSTGDIINVIAPETAAKFYRKRD